MGSSLNFNNIKNGINPIIIGAFLTGIALVLADSWGQAIKKTISILVNKVRCSKYVILNDPEKYDKCTKDDNVLSLYLNALITSLIVYLFIRMILGNKVAKKIGSQRR